MSAKSSVPPARRLVFALAAAAATAAVLYAGAWTATAYVLQDQARRWIAAQRQDGLQIAHAEPRLSGFPGRVVVTYADWTMAAPVTAGGWTWRAPEIRLAAAPWAPLRFAVDLAGPHALSGVWTPPGVAATIAAARAELRPVLTAEGRLAEVAANAEGLSLGPADGPPAITLGHGALAIARFGPPAGEALTWRFSLSIAALAAPALGELGGLAPAVSRLAVTADLTGPLGPGPLPTALQAWREGGGTVELRDVVLDWPPLRIDGTGTLALDERLQPIGAMTAKVRGFFETVDALTARGLVRSSDAGMARIVLGLLARTPEGGGPPELNLAVTVQDRKLYTGPVTLMDLPAVTWPSDAILP